ncbi:hypothetical protein E4665_07755 [Sporolactobacillus shoreae]|uniref:Uncharacterized protein n=2 Tax=Sporolactobacillus shoreae TaxID=1465501 RepID=A0A4Z0GNM0_9BACL|nr:hypothetical protein E4665_07755 [Sporolactobacillus shoreae]
MRAMTKGGGGEISLNPGELERFAVRAQAISEIFQNKIEPEIGKLARLGYYADGEAADTFTKYRQALEKMRDVGDFYARAAQLLMFVAESMASQDEALAQAYDEGAVQ